mmetsp:Transcript_15246/g.35135  ORF Transcript_15246/g.35135 Transcript_15246/m.35135 type:complete len:316 (+) Transcript_15246:143-1090(+)
MSSRPLLLHAFRAPRCALWTPPCIQTAQNSSNFPNEDVGYRRKLSTGIATTTGGRASLPVGNQQHYNLGRCLTQRGEALYPLRQASLHTISIGPLSWLRPPGVVGGSRSFASRRGKKSNKSGNHNSNGGVLSNEDLVGRLIRDAGASSADKVTVRLVIDEGPDTPSSVEILSLTEAIGISLDRELDLIGGNISGDPPVIRATDLSKLEYKHKQAQKKQQQAAANRKELKSFRFKAGIESNDLERKLDRLKGFLTKGHDCEFTVFCRLRTLRQNPNAGIELVNQIRILLSDHGDIKREPKTNETKSFYRVRFEPKK